MLYEIQSENIKLTVSTDGGQMLSLLHNGIERLWQNEVGGWSEHAPLLFPVAGHVAAFFDGKEYPLPAHGFAKKMPFALIEKGENFITLGITETKETLAVYPFRFRFTVTYTLVKNKLTVIESVTNTDEKNLPYFLGGHESYNTFAPLEECKLVFPKAEHLATLLLTPDGGYLNGEEMLLSDGDTLPLPADFLMENRSLIFKDVSSRYATLFGAGGKKLAKIGFGDIGNLLLWRPDGAKTVCIEPWYGLPDTIGAPADTPFEKKSGARIVAPGETSSTVREIEYY